MLNMIKVVFLGILLVTGISFFTAKKPPQAEQIREIKVGELVNYRKNLPYNFEIVGREGYTKKDNLFIPEMPMLIVVANHDAINVANGLKKYYKIDLPYIVVANISDAPWFVKKWAIPTILEELKANNTTMILDSEGYMKKALRVYDINPTKFFAYKLEKDGKIVKIFESQVKQGAMQGSMNEDEIKKVLLPLAQKVQSK